MSWSKKDITEKQAREFAAQHNILVGTKKKNGDITSVQVGNMIVFWNKNKGGSSCYQIDGYLNNTTIGPIGKTIELAVSLQLKPTELQPSEAVQELINEYSRFL